MPDQCFMSQSSAADIFSTNNLY